ncbi:MAG: hypothetical protein LBG30_00195 [Odoribacteraceae bacterium]|jgi:hypothetical protein|nr:hypothetical protein [Odoribacteraceae bacterium]
MKKFLIRVGVFGCAVAIAAACLAGGAYWMLSRASFKLPAGKHILVVGASRAECAVDDRIFASAVNVAQSACPYLYTYGVIRKFLEENEQLDTVIVSFHYSTLTENIDERWIFRESAMNYKIPLHLSLMDKEDLSLFSHRKLMLIKSVLNLPYRDVVRFILRGGKASYRELNIGRYLRLERDKLQEAIARREETSGERGLSIFQRDYLQKIAGLCKSRGAELILMTMPLYKPEVYGEMEKLNAYREAYLPDAKYMDYSAFPLADSCRGDIQHLNYKGAAVFSEYLRDHLSRDIALKYGTR